MIRLDARTPHGLLVVRPIAGLSPLHPEEAALAAAWGEPRRRTFAAGRAALREALTALGVDASGPILRSARGAPLLPPRVAASVSHKDRVAAALAAVDDAALGVDIEELNARRGDVSAHVLTARELEAVRGDLRAMLVRFSLKEALYKAIDPTVQRYVGFHEVEVEPQPDGSALFVLSLKHGEGPFAVDGRWQIVNELVITSVRVERG